MTAPAPSSPIVVHDADQASKLEAIAASGACEAGRPNASACGSCRRT